MEENKQYRKTEHHLVLLFDELDRLSELFDIGVKSMDFDIKGSKSISKDNIKPTEGVTICSHSFVSVNQKGVVAHNAFEVQRIIHDLAEYGATTCYITRLLVEWNDGRIDQWKRRTIPALTGYVQRSSGIARKNVLTIIRPTSEELISLGERYGDLAAPTNCPVSFVEGKEMRSCGGLLKMW